MGLGWWVWWLVVLYVFYLVLMDFMVEEFLKVLVDVCVWVLWIGLVLNVIG